MGVDHITFSQPIVEQITLDLVSTEDYAVRLVVLRDQQYLTLKFEGNIDLVNGYTSIQFNTQPLPLSFRPAETQVVILPLVATNVIGQATLTIGADGNLSVSFPGPLNAPVGIPATTVTTVLRQD